MTDDILQAIEVLKQGGIVLYPTDTHWALGCDATNNNAVERLHKAKNRSSSKHILILMENPALLDRYVRDVPEIAWDLIEISTTPLTLVFSKYYNLAENLVEPGGNIGIRFTREAFSRGLVQRFRRPVVASSANLHGGETPLVFSGIRPEIISSADYVVSYRQDDQTPVASSSVIRLGEGGRIEILRD